jgi:hypothetical protein
MLCLQLIVVTEPIQPLIYQVMSNDAFTATYKYDYLLALPYMQIFLDMFPFSDFRIVSGGGGFFNFPKIPRFWPLSIVCDKQGCYCSSSKCGMRESQESC